MSEPILGLEARDAVRVDGAWRVRWRVTNGGTDQVRLATVRAPHNRFRSDPVDLNAVIVEQATVEQTVRIDAGPGEEIENAFVIFVAEQDDETWRVLFRVRVHMSADGTPSPIVEATSSHRVGFSEV